ncbi:MULTISPECIES: ArpU family phage packaging/lysis transcriptional regulator [Enterococcus]|uniref:ArpU family phage packaging/lysis transcriptional regulator n=1 Tax=Enterococcus TaxID=1350 RepID=UPI002DBBA8A8|nr:ArpU family phage packaging/lysis transcriptional regulator [Enterococcus faecalis]MEB5927379.1 hypothetical protein [Enterococcus faecalis]
MVSEKEIRQRAKKVLKNYDKYKRIAGKDDSLKSVVLSDMPKNVSRVNYNENRLINRIDAQNILQSISEALEMLDSEHKELLERIYIYQKHKTQLYIADMMGWSIKSLERHHALALVEFAEAYHYEDLLF